MAIPTELQELITAGLLKIKNDPNHDLNLGYREAIYSALGPYAGADGNSDNSGHLKRVFLATIAVSRVLPLWQQTWPEDETVQCILAKVNHIMSKPQEVDEEAMDEEIEHLWEYTTELTDETREIGGIVGMAAVAALSLAQWDGFMEEEEIDLERTDSDDFMLNDGHFYAASAYAGGPPYPIALAEQSSPTKRQEFWQWWLTSAVPAAWLYGKDCYQDGKYKKWQWTDGTSNTDNIISNNNLPLDGTPRIPTSLTSDADPAGFEVVRLR